MSRRETAQRVAAGASLTAWLRHRVAAASNGYRGRPFVVAEVAPGLSLGTGIAALLTGSEAYITLDDAEQDLGEEPLGVLDPMVELLRARSAPVGPVDDELLDRSLEPARVERIRRALTGDADLDGPTVRRLPSWRDRAPLDADGVDFLFSDGVLGNVLDIDRAYGAMGRLLGRGGFLSHQMDLRTARPLDDHLRAARAAGLENVGFDVIDLARSAVVLHAVRR
jgi:hypothetical protein